MISKKTTDLKPGDVVKFADLFDRVIWMRKDNYIVDVCVMRNGQKITWSAGVDSYQDVLTEDEAKNI